jgi:hypothetical protein
MKIGLVGEAPADTTAIKNLLLKRYRQHRQEFVTMLDRINGSMLDNQKTKRLLRIEYETQKPTIVIFIRDLDGTLKNNTTLAARKDFFRNFNSVVNKTGVFLLNIYEIEAILVADINAFNNYFGSAIQYDGDPMELENPKEFLKMHCPKYNESLNPALFGSLNFDTVYIKCRYFNGFITRFEKKLSTF